MFHRDRFTCWLAEHRPDLPVARYAPGAILGGPQLGWQLTLGRTRFVYRVPAEKPDIFYIILIERGPSRAGLRSPFADMVRLLLMIKDSESGIRWIRGTVEPTRDAPADALERKRIRAFYHRYLTAVSDGFENGAAWMGGDLTAFSWKREKRKITETRLRRARR
jgi:hypothetical protein